MLYQMTLMNGREPGKVEYASSIGEHMVILRSLRGYAGAYVGHRVVDGNEWWEVYHTDGTAKPNDPTIAVIVTFGN